MPLSPDDVQNKRFTVVRFGKSGYDEEEVDTFLDEIEAELRRLLSENSSLRAQAAATPAPVATPEAPAAPPPAPAEDPNETALRTLLLAQRTADDAIAQAKAEAEKVVTDARGRAAALDREAQTSHETKIAELSAQRAAIEAEIADLRNFEREYRTRLRAYLEGQLGELEKLTSTAPSMPARPAPAATTPAAANPPLSTPVAPNPAAPPPNPAAPPAAAPNPAAPPPAVRPTTPDAAEPAVPSLAPPAVPRVAAPPSGGPFSSAPTPTVAPRTSLPAFDTDVDAGSDIPTGPPAQAADVTDEARD
ncbi:MAG: DivIVA domain-containing protein [Frankiaceae bacterium]|nr:DivIVA domain-containing protein [Frankiaceae bacterium]MBV9870012.1 DivIVA domain-containing protein [Frankiaceae bacterium]